VGNRRTRLFILQYIKENDMGIYDMGYNTNQYSKIFDRLYSPDEFNNLPSGQKVDFQNYMDYVTQYQKRKRMARPNQSGTQRIPQGGVLQIGGGGSAVKSGTIGRAVSRGSAASGSKIPPYRIEKDISGNIRYVPVGGTHKTIGGEAIPQTLEAQQQGLALGTAIPTMEAESATQLATKEALALKAQRAKGVEEYLAEKTPEEQYKESIRGQAAQRIEQAGQRIGISTKGMELKWKQYDKLPAKERLEKIRHDNRADNIELREILRGKRDKLKAGYDIDKLIAIGKVAGTDQAKAEDSRILERERAKAVIKLEEATSKEDRAFQLYMIKHLDKKIYNNEKVLGQVLPFGAERDTKKLEADIARLEEEKKALMDERTQPTQSQGKVEQSNQPPEEGAYWSEKQGKWWKRNADGTIKWF